MPPSTTGMRPAKACSGKGSAGRGAPGQVLVLPRVPGVLVDAVDYAVKLGHVWRDGGVAAHLCPPPPPPPRLTHHLGQRLGAVTGAVTGAETETKCTGLPAAMLAVAGAPLHRMPSTGKHCQGVCAE